MVVYIAGKVTGLDMEAVKAKFETAEGLIIAAGNTPINPLRITSHLPKGSSWEEYMKVCLPAIVDADVVGLLHDWKDSRGAIIEKQIAEAFDKAVFEFDEVLTPVTCICTPTHTTQ